jgi:hypothetical protein
MLVTADFKVRGGISTLIEAEYRSKEYDENIF